MRIAGLSSGMDTEQLIKDIMNAERIPVDRVFQQKVKAEWKRDAYRDINTKLLRLRNLSFDLGLQGTFSKNLATSSHENLVTATAKGSAQVGTFEIKVEELAEGAKFISNSELNEAAFADLKGETLEFRGLDGKTVEIEISEQDTIKDVFAKINRHKNLGINAYYDEHSKLASFTTKGTGEGSKIEVVNDHAKNFFKDVFGAEFLDGDVLAQGKNAKLNINGIETQRESNSFDLNGITVNLKEAEKNTTIRIEVKQDTDAIVNQVKEFVDLYNELIDEFNISIREETFRDFPPLTDAQRADLSDKEIEMWEEKAKSGLLRSDRLVSNILSEMRLALGANVQGLEGNKSLAQIGIKTGAWYEHGKLYVDEDKLRAAVEEDPSGVQAIFTQQSDSSSELGLAKRLTTVLDNGMKRISDTAGKASSPYDQSFLGKQIRNYEDRLNAMEERLIRVEQMHWNKFTAMERVLGQLYAQGDWLSQQLMTMMG